jgi:hypothetical protein
MSKSSEKTKLTLVPSPQKDPKLPLEERYEEVKALIQLGKDKGYLNPSDMAALLPEELIGSDEIEDLYLLLEHYGIDILDTEDVFQQVIRKKELGEQLHEGPPTPQEIDAFVRDTARDAYEKLIDQLLASPRLPGDIRSD